MHDGGWRWRKDKAPPPLLARNFLSKCFRLRGLLVSRVTMARIVSQLHPETRQRGASQNYSPFPWSTTRFCRLLPPKVESLHDFLKRWRVETRVWISRFEKNCVISVYIREIVVCTRNRVIKFIRSILILKGNFYSFENIYCIFFLAGVCRVFQNKAIF